MNKFYTDKIYVLYQNNNEKDRFKQYIERNKININYSMFKSIENTKNINKTNSKTNINDEKFNKYIKYYNNYKLNENQNSHILSFIKILEDAIKNNFKSITILEYDIYVNKNLINLLPKYKTLITNSDIIYLGSSQHYWYNPIFNTRITINNNYYNASHSLGTFGIILKKHIFTKFKNYLNTFTLPTDVILSIISYNFNSFVLYHNLIICDLSRSSILKNRDNITLFLKFKWNKLNYIIN